MEHWLQSANEANSKEVLTMAGMGVLHSRVYIYGVQKFLRFAPDYEALMAFYEVCLSFLIFSEQS